MAASKNEDAYIPTTPIEKLAYAGDYDGTVAYLEGLSEAQRYKLRAAVRRILKLGWRLSGLQKRAIYAAAFLCCTTDDFAGGCSILSYDSAREVITNDLILLWPRFRPRATHDLVEALLKCDLRLVNMIQPLFLANVIERPRGDSYALGLMTLDRFDCSIYRWVERDPELLLGPVLKLFEIEGALIYDSWDSYWSDFILKYLEEGIYSRTLLIDKTIAALEANWSSHHTNWFTHFYETLSPTLAEMEPHAARYVDLCLSRNSPTVSLAISSLEVLYVQEKVFTPDVMSILPAVLSTRNKGQIDLVLNLLDKFVKKSSVLASEAAAIAVFALTHEAPDVHKKVIKRLKSWGMDTGARKFVRDLIPQTSATTRDALIALLGEDKPIASVTAPQLDVALPERRSPLSPLDESRKLHPIEGIDELVDRTAYVLENGTEIDEFERVVDALVRLAPFPPEAAQSFAPVIARAHKLKPIDDGDFVGKPLERELARLIVFLFNGERLEPVRAYDKAAYRSYPAIKWRMNNCNMHSFLCQRIDDLMDLAVQGKSLSPLASPTHCRGFIDANILVRRVAEHYKCGAESSLQEQVLSILRLARRDDEAKELARFLPITPYTIALRYALGDMVVIGEQRELFVAAGRVRFPNEDDPNLIFAYGYLGPDGSHVAHYSWCVQSMVLRIGASTNCSINLGEKHVARVTDPGFLSIIRHPGEESNRVGYHCNDRFGTEHESLILLSALITPNCLDAFFAEGVRVIAANVDWYSAQWCNRAYLALLLDPTIPMTPMAQWVLAYGLAGKEPGQCAIAIDALIATWIEGRLEVKSFGALLQELPTTLQIKASRLHKSLKTAARAHILAPRLVFDLLCTLVIPKRDSPPKDIWLLLELLLELTLELKQPVPAATRAAVEGMKITGKGRAVQKEFLTRIVA